MFELEVSGWKKLFIKNLLLDFNGTLAIDGVVDEKAVLLCREILKKYNLKSYIITAATNPVPEKILEILQTELIIIEPGNEAWQKLNALVRIGAEVTAAAGNGANDELMLSVAALGIAVFNGEGACPEALLAADIVVKNAVELFELFLYPKRLYGTLRR